MNFCPVFPEIPVREIPVPWTPYSLLLLSLDDDTQTEREKNKTFRSVICVVWIKALGPYNQKETRNRVADLQPR